MSSPSHSNGNHSNGEPALNGGLMLFTSKSQQELAALHLLERTSEERARSGSGAASLPNPKKREGMDVAAKAPVLSAFMQGLINPLSDGAASVVDDSFSCCFQSQPYEPWNWNFYLFPLWCVGVVVRHGFLFPIRLLSLLLGMVLFIVSFTVANNAISDVTKRKRIESSLIVFMCNVFVWSWTGVVRFHGPQPSRGAKVFVANHTSMIDFIVLESLFPFAVIMQKHGGWVGWFQTRILNAIGCIYFDRTDSSDRAVVAKRIKEHVHASGSNPLLIFPEGTCVNNEHCVMFKRSAFDLDVPVCPIAIKYNKTFVDAFWNSKRESFTMHLYKLMTSWAVVADVWFLEPMEKLQDESSIDFAARVQKMIAERANLRVVPWDGMYKYVAPKPETRERRRRAFAELMKSSLQKEKKP